MKKLALFIFVLFFVNHHAFSQSPSVIWQKCYGSYNGDYAYTIHQTTDGGYIVAGSTESGGGDIMGYHGNPYIGDYWVIKLNSAGVIQWQKCLGGLFQELCGDVKQTPDGGYIVAGSSSSQSCDVTGVHGYGLDYWIVKLSANGDIMWQKSYGGTDHEYAYSIDNATGGGYFVAGFTQSSDGDVTVNHGYRDFWVIKIDNNGTLVWQKSLGGTGDDEAFSVKATADGGCVVAGYTTSTDGDVTTNHGKEDVWVVKLSNGGSIQWQKSLGGSMNDWANSIQTTPDGGYILGGTTTSADGDVSGNHNGIGPGDADYWVVKLTGTGNIEWQHCYGGDFNEIAYCITPTPDGGYVVGGSAESPNGDATCNSGITDMWVIKITSTGQLEWQKSMGGSSYDQANSVEPLADGNYIVAGSTCSKEVAGYHVHNTPDGTCDDYMVVKLSPPPANTPSPQVSIQPAGNVCIQGKPTFTATALYAGTGPSYQWLKNGNSVGSNSAVYTAAGLANGDKITCNVTAGGGCETSNAEASAAVTINAGNTISPQINITASSTLICGCTSVTLKANIANGGAAPLYKWLLNGFDTLGNSNVFISSSFNDGDKITCVYTDNSGCIAGDSVVSNTITMTAGTSVAPDVNISTPDTAACAGSPVTFTASAQNAGTSPTYQWQVNGTNAGTNSSSFTSSILVNGDKVTCDITTDPSFACASVNNATSNTVVVKELGKGQPSITITSPTDSICIGQSITFMATAANAGTNPTYQWLVNGSNEGTNSYSFTSASFANGDTVTCTITADTSFKCATAPSVTSNNIIVGVKNQQPPSATITSPANEVCAGSTLTFNATSQNTGVSPSYQWVVNNTPVNDNTDIFSSNTLNNGDALYCAVTPSAGSCSTTPVSSNTIIAVVNPLPQVSVTPADSVITTGASIQLTGNVSANTTTYQWTPPGQLSNPESLTPLTVALMENTTFTLTVESDKGCKSTAQATIEVGRPLLMPSAFTPNGDMINDIFRIPAGVTLNLQEFSIFNRWGSRIFTTRDVSKGWDGTYNGATADVGVYVYVIKGTDSKGPVFVKGTVVVVR